MGMNALSQSDILSFFILHGINPEPWEIEFIYLFDNVAIKQYIEDHKS